MKKCQSCGNELKSGGKFCAKCGAPVVDKVENKESVVTEISSAPIIPNGNVTGQLPPDNMGIAGFICGILGITICCGITSIPALICSIISMKNVKKGKVQADNSWMGIVGLVLGILGTLCILALVAYYLLLIFFAFAVSSGV